MPSETIIMRSTRALIGGTCLLSTFGGMRFLAKHYVASYPLTYTYFYKHYCTSVFSNLYRVYVASSILVNCLLLKFHVSNKMPKN